MERKLKLDHYPNLQLVAKSNVEDRHRSLRGLVDSRIQSKGPILIDTRFTTCATALRPFLSGSERIQRLFRLCFVTAMSS